MQKKLIALAIAGLSSAAFAQTNVTLYGVADVSFESAKANGATNNPAGTNVPSRTRLSTNGSLIGFKGTEDLGDGLKAIFQFESNVSTDRDPTYAGNTTSGGFGSIGTGGNLLGSSRDTFVGLSGGFGTVKLGYLSTPLRSLVRGYDVMPGSTGIGEIGGVFAVAPNGNQSLVSNTTGANSSLLFRSQSIRYDSPDLAGFTGSLAYMPNEGKSNNTPGVSTNEVNPYGWNLGLNYAIAGFKVGYSYMKLNDTGTAGLAEEDLKTHILGAGYDFGQGTSLVAMYQISKDKQTPVAPAAGFEVKRKAFWVAAKHVMGPHEFALAYARAKELEGIPVTTVNPNTDTDAHQISLRYGYSLSKRTQAYAVVSKITNESAAAFDFGTAGVGGFTAGADPTAFGAGIRHNF